MKKRMCDSLAYLIAMKLIVYFLAIGEGVHA